MIINVDVDGVLYDFVGALRSHIRSKMGDPDLVLPDPTSWHIWNHWTLGSHPMTKQDFYAWFKQAVEHGNLFGQPQRIITEQAPSVLLDWKMNLGHNVRFVTRKKFPVHEGDMSALAQGQTEKFLHYWGLDEIPIFYVGDGVEKTSYPADLAIDDDPNLQRWVNPDQNAVNILFRQPWNDEVTSSKPPRLIRSNRWDKIDKIVNVMSGEWQWSLYGPVRKGTTAETVEEEQSLLTLAGGVAALDPTVSLFRRHRDELITTLAAQIGMRTGVAVSHHHAKEIVWALEEVLEGEDDD